MRHLISQVLSTYRNAAFFCLAAFPLFLIPVLFEGLQHIVEVQLGMFAENRATAFDAADQKLRLVFGGLKAISLLSVMVLSARFFLFEQKLAKTLAFSSGAKRAVLLGGSFLLLSLLWIFLIGPHLVEWVRPAASVRHRTLIPLFLILLPGLFFQNQINNWLADVLDQPRLDDGENKAINKAMRGGLSLVILLAILPLMVAHYGLNAWSMGQPRWQLFISLGLDSFLVGAMAVVMGTSLSRLWQGARTRYQKSA